MSEDRKHREVEIHCLREGGYMVTAARTYDSRLRDEFRVYEPIAAFTTLDEALRWLANRLEDRPSRS